MKRLLHTLCIMLGLLPTGLFATEITWTASRLVDANSISTDGALLEALNPGRPELGGDVTVNGVTFAGKHDTNDTDYFRFADDTGNPTGPPPGSAYSGDLTFGDALLDGFYWDNNKNQLMLKGLTPGVTYPMPFASTKRSSKEPRSSERKTCT